MHPLHFFHSIFTLFLLFFFHFLSLNLLLPVHQNLIFGLFCHSMNGGTGEIRMGGISSSAILFIFFSLVRPLSLFSFSLSLFSPPRAPLPTRISESPSTRAEEGVNFMYVWVARVRGRFGNQPDALGRGSWISLLLHLVCCYKLYHSLPGTTVRRISLSLFLPTRAQSHTPVRRRMSTVHEKGKRVRNAAGNCYFTLFYA